jgi:Fe-S-cluster containining protein
MQCLYVQHGISQLTNRKFLMEETSLLDKRPTRYLCQRCGNCCRWPGDVRVTEEEVVAIARFMGLSVEEFVQGHTRLNANRTGLSIMEKEDGACFFLAGRNECLIQPVKPVQCSGFPNDWNFPGWREQCEAIEMKD